VEHTRAHRSGCRQHPVVGRRQVRGSLRFTDDEWAVIVQAAALERMRPGAWAQQAAYRAGVRRCRGPLPELTAVQALVVELRQQRRVLANIGGNLNDLAAAANATGRIDNQVAATTVLRLVRRVVEATQELIGRVGAEVLARA
jgi:hypothetical protein